MNFSISAVGVLLINGLLIVPGATANNLSTNLRQMFRRTFVLSILTGIAGLYLSQSIRLSIDGGGPKQFGVSGTILCFGVFLFALSMLWPSVRRRFARLGRPSPLHHS